MLILNFWRLFLTKKGGNQPERELSSCFGQALLWEPALPSPAGQGAARAGGRLAVGTSRGGGLLSIPPPMPGQRGGSEGHTAPTPALPASARGRAEGGSQQLAPCRGIVLGLNGRQPGFSGDWKPFPGSGNSSCPLRLPGGLARVPVCSGGSSGCRAPMGPWPMLG